MRPGMKIWIILASIVLFWSGVFCLVCCSDNLDDRAADMAEKALRASVDNPESIRILAVSKPDSVFGHTYITQERQGDGRPDGAADGSHVEPEAADGLRRPA